MNVDMNIDSVLDSVNYKIEVDTRNKQIIVRLAGSFTKENLEDLFGQYEKKLKKINPREYNMVIDCYNLNVFKPEIIPCFEEVFYEFNEYKRVTLINSLNRISVFQVQRIIRNIKQNKFEFIDKKNDISNNLI